MTETNKPLQEHGKIKTKDVDMAATSFAMTVHSMMDYQLDCAGMEQIKNSAEDVSQNYDEVKYAREQKTCGMLENYIKWFCSEFGGDGNEKKISHTKKDYHCTI